MARRLKPTDAGYAALLLGCDLDAATLGAALLFLNPDEENCELCAWDEETEVLKIDSTVGLLDAHSLGFVPGWSQKKA